MRLNTASAMESVLNPSHNSESRHQVTTLTDTVRRGNTMAEVVVAGHLMVEPENRDDYLSTCVEVVRQARASAGCRDFAVSADLLDPGRINVYERWDSQSAVDAFRGSGHSDEQGAATISASVAEFDVAQQRSLT
jgi:quinol monooxygenase YgiN